LIGPDSTPEVTMAVIAKLGNKIVRIVKFARDVQFSQDKNWLLIDTDEVVDKPNTVPTTLMVKWVPATTRFEWIRNFNFR
jgi:hypothetical protein